MPDVVGKWAKMFKTVFQPDVLASSHFLLEFAEQEKGKLNFHIAAAFHGITLQAVGRKAQGWDLLFCQR